MDLSRVLELAEQGNVEARGNLIQAAYDDLHRLAAAKMADERIGHTLTSTALLHEVSLKMLADTELPTQGRAQFFAYASKAMRNFLIDYARTRGRQKRGGNAKKFSLDEAVVACQEQKDELLALNDALDALSQLEPRKAQVVEMRYFGGLTNQEVADSLGVSLATVKRDWEVAKTWLLHTLQQEEPEETSSSPDSGS